MQMKQWLAFALVSLITIVVSVNCLSASENVAKFSRNDAARCTPGTPGHPPHPPVCGPAVEIANQAGASGQFDRESFVNSHSFTVYTTSEVDGMIQALTNSDKALSDEVNLLKGNMKTLSDANDALTKRLNELEARANKPAQAQ